MNRGGSLWNHGMSSPIVPRNKVLARPLDEGDLRLTISTLVNEKSVGVQGAAYMLPYSAAFDLNIGLVRFACSLLAIKASKNV